MSLTYSNRIDIRPPKPKKIGRNEPCYCGSGKKYKKCCLPKDQSAVTPPDTQDGSIAKIVDWCIDQPWFESHLKSHLQFLHKDAKEITEIDFQEASSLSIFASPVTFHTPFELFIQKAPLSSEEQAYYQRWLEEMVYSLFEIQSVELGHGMVVTDIFTGIKYDLHEKLGTYSLKTGEIIATRIVPKKDFFMTTGGGVSLFPQAAKPQLLKMTEPPDEFVITQIKHDRNSQADHEPIESLLDLSATALELTLALKEIGITTPLSTLLPKNQIDILKLFIQQMNQHSPKPEHTSHVIGLALHYLNLSDSQKSQQIGSQEQQLLKQLSHALTHSLNSNELESPTKIDRFQQQWLETPQASLNHQTPRQVILEERKKTGDSSTKIGVQIYTFSPPSQDCIDQANHAVSLTKQGNFYQALLTYADVVPLPPDFPETFRIYGNIATCLINLGFLELGETFARKIAANYPDYQLVKTNLKLVSNQHQRHKAIEKGIANLFAQIMSHGITLPDFPLDSALLQDLTTFIGYVQHNQPALTAKLRYLKRHDLLKLNQQLTEPESTTEPFPKRSQTDFYALDFLYRLCLKARWLKFRSQTLILTRKGSSFLKLTPHQKLSNLITIWWQPHNFSYLSQNSNWLTAERHSHITFTCRLIWPLLYQLSLLKQTKQLNFEMIIDAHTNPPTSSDPKEKYLFRRLIIGEVFISLVKPLAWLGALSLSESPKIHNLFDVLNRKKSQHPTSTLLGNQLVTAILATAPQCVPPKIKSFIENYS